MAPRNSDREDVDVVIIGAGVSGLCMAIDLIRKNETRNFIIAEQSSEIGGTWNDNRYPGCAADAASHLYSLSFDPDLDCRFVYSTRDGTYSYLHKLAERWDLYKHIRLNTVVKSAAWMGDEKAWQTVLCKKGESAEYSIVSSYLVSAVGQLNVPRIPDIPGLDSFKGAAFHTSRWDLSQTLEGKRVAVVGNGASAVQLIPEVAKKAAHLTVFQRSANWVIPRHNIPISWSRRALYRYMPGAYQNYREELRKDQEKVHQMMVSPKVREFVGGLTMTMMKNQIPDDDDLRARLMPTHPPGCKRVALSDFFFSSMNLPHVSLETRPIKQITPNGIIAGGEEEEFDIIVFATGFHALEVTLGITGLDGRTLQDAWQDGPRAYLGVAVESLPNFGMLYGPNTNLGHISILLMIEPQALYISKMISAVQDARRAGESLVLTPKTSRVNEYNDELQARLGATVFADPGCTSWYKTKDGKITSTWPGTSVEYAMRLSTLDWDYYEKVGSSPGALPRNRIEVITEVSKQPTSSVISRSTWLISVAVITLAFVGSGVGTPFFKRLSKFGM